MELYLSALAGDGPERTYEAGQTVPRSGVYEVSHPCAEPRRTVFLRGQQFPECVTCGAQVRYRLVRPAPHISEDEDFAQ
jgi:hypothetical protein